MGGAWRVWVCTPDMFLGWSRASSQSVGLPTLSGYWLTDAQDHMGVGGGGGGGGCAY